MSVEPSVFIVDDDPATRESLQWLVERGGFHAEAYESALAFLKAFQPERAGCLILDVQMPGMTGLDLQEQLAALNVTLPVIIITGHADVATAVRAMKGGAVDFLQKPFQEQILFERIHQAISLDYRRRNDRVRFAEIEMRMHRLTPREKQVMQLVFDGKANRQIATILQRSEKTVEIHRAHVMKKMEAGSLADLFRLVEDHTRLSDSI